MSLQIRADTRGLRRRLAEPRRSEDRRALHIAPGVGVLAREGARGKAILIMHRRAQYTGELSQNEVQETKGKASGPASACCWAWRVPPGVAKQRSTPFTGQPAWEGRGSTRAGSPCTVEHKQRAAGET